MRFAHEPVREWPNTRGISDARRMSAVPTFRVPRRPATAERRDTGTAAVPLADADSFPAFDAHRRPWPGREITSGGVTLHVRETPGPDGTPAVYVHGLGGSALNWTDLAALLGTRAAGTAVDLPGFGRTPPARRFRLHPGRARRRPAVLPRRPQRAGAPARQLPRRRGRAQCRRATSRARPHADARLARDARPPPRPAAHGGRPARAGAGARPDRGTRSGRARRHRAARPGRADDPGLLRRPVAACPSTGSSRPPRRSSCAAGWSGPRRRGSGPPRPWSPSWWWGASPWAVGRAGAGADARRLGRPRPARLARAWPPAPRRRSRGRGCSCCPGVGHVAQIEAPETVARAVAGTVGRAVGPCRGAGRRPGKMPDRSGVARRRTDYRSRSTDGATAARGAGRRAVQGRGGALQPPPDHPRRRDGRAEAAQEREGARRRRRRSRQPRAALPRRRRCGHARDRRVRRRRLVQPPAPDHPRPVGRRPLQGRVRPRLDQGDEPVRRGPAARAAAGLDERARRLPRLRPDPGRHGQLRHPLPGQRRRRAARQALRLGLDLPVRGPGVGVLGGRAERAGPQLPRPLPRAPAARDGPVVRRGRRAGRAVRVDRLDHGQRGHQADHRHRRDRCSAG